ncbi:hypothetical protein PFUGPA_03513 [Plasmodium falciparum Palo Alto/Uganda]|uniref:Uncharacterized protein n=2 Tax=Plasmodium falciparum TaxID=5833 RepID=W4IV18_PLAFP|nr:hypothetical protein PFNF135_05195 [Plasmodium falciparum NF135/5.C10]ETW53639.1 hypothetical protein PFUGPA_03513 [Plasmodium falciparum Palo Alto/Uganda]
MLYSTSTYYADILNFVYIILLFIQHINFVLLHKRPILQEEYYLKNIIYIFFIYNIKKYYYIFFNFISRIILIKTT